MAFSVRDVKKERSSVIERIWPVKRVASCESALTPRGIQWIKRADPERLEEVFLKYSSVNKNGEQFMSIHDFVRNYLGLLPDSDYNEVTLKMLGNAVDTTKNGLVSFEEFHAFEAMLAEAAAMYALAFQIFDSDGSGAVSYGEFENVLKHTTVDHHIPFNFDCDFINLHFGKEKKRQVNYAEFTQILHDFHEEHAIQAFKKYDINHAGFISTLEFSDIMKTLKKHLLTFPVEQNLVTVAGSEKAHKVSFPYFVAFISLLNNMELIKKLYTTATRGDDTAELTKEEFLHEAQNYTQITPMEIDILFQLVDAMRQSGRINERDLEAISPIKGSAMPYSIQARYLQESVDKMSANTAGQQSFGMKFLENAYRFMLGAAAGAVGATAVYPIDLVKTRMQNQRSGTYVGELMYKNSWDCFRKVIRYENFGGLYRGLGPQLVGVAPEKAIKLTVNDLIRDTLHPKDGELPIWAEALSGGCAGASQVVFTNPLEIVKIRLQVAGEIASTERISAIAVIRSLGFLGLYKGARACFLRDIPFSAIYFTMYAHSKALLANEDGYNHPLTILAAGAIAARVLRSSPQFGVTLLTYELLQRSFYVDFGGRPLSGSKKGLTLDEVLTPINPDHIGGYRLALATFEGIETKFGLCLPKFRNPIPSSSTN